MIRHSFALASLCTVLTASLFSSSTSAEPLTGAEVEGLLLELKNIEEGLDGNRVSLRTNAVRAFEQASTTDKAAYDFFLQCHKTIKFDAKDASFSEFREWRERSEKRLKTKANIAAMRLQLQYLVLTMRAAEGVKRETLIPELENFVANIVAHAKDLEDQGSQTLRNSVKNTIFAEAYKLNKTLEVENWCFEPGNFGGVYERTVFPFMRAEHKDKLADAWDRRIGLEKKWVLITKEDNQYELDKFEQERLPTLYWNKAVDIFRNTSQQQGAQTMLSILKTHYSHTSSKGWLEEFRNLLSSGGAPQL